MSADSNTWVPHGGFCLVKASKMKRTSGGDPASAHPPAGQKRKLTPFGLDLGSGGLDYDSVKKQIDRGFDNTTRALEALINESVAHSATRAQVRREESFYLCLLGVCGILSPPHSLVPAGERNGGSNAHTHTHTRTLYVGAHVHLG